MIELIYFASIGKKAVEKRQNINNKVFLQQKELYLLKNEMFIESNIIKTRKQFCF